MCMYNVYCTFMKLLHLIDLWNQRLEQINVLKKNNYDYLNFFLHLTLLLASSFFCHLNFRIRMVFSFGTIFDLLIFSFILYSL